MITSTHRFHGRSSLRFVYQRGQTVRGELFSLRYVRNDRQRVYRVAVVVSRKVSKSAVVRNRIRRRLYEIVRNHAARIAVAHDLVFTVYGEAAASMSHATLQKLVIGQLERAGVLAKPSRPSEAERGIVETKETNK
jgi:ribonuclease P protein component